MFLLEIIIENRNVYLVPLVRLDVEAEDAAGARGEDASEKKQLNLIRERVSD